MNAQAKTKTRVLIVDDSADNLRFFRKVLENRYSIDTAENGEEALALLRKEPADLILSDIVMPVMDGFRLLQECKSDPKLQKIPLVFITGAFLDKKDEDLASRIGVSGFIRKPVEPADLISTVEDSLSKARLPKRGRKRKIDEAAAEKQFSTRLMEKLRAKMKELDDEAEERRKAEDALHTAEAEYSSLLETMEQGIICIDADAKVIFYNPAAQRILGWPQDKPQGMTITDPRLRTVHEDGTALSADEFPLIVALKTGKPVKGVPMGVYNPADDQYHWVRGSAVPQFRPGEDRPYRVYATFDDITDQFLTFKALQANESRLSAILENTTDAIISVDREFRVTAVNEAAKKFYVMVAGPVEIGDDILDRMSSERQAFWKGIMDEALCGRRQVFENHYDTDSGSFDMEFSVNPVASPSGNITGISLFGRDITGRKLSERALSQSEEALQQSEQRFRKAVQSTTDIVWDWDINSGQVDWYGDIDRMLGYDAGEFPRTLAAREASIHPDDHDRVVAALNRHAQTGEPYNIEYRLCRRDGSTRIWIDRGLVVRDSAGEITRSVGACVDITEHRLSDQRIKIRRDLAVTLASVTDIFAVAEHGVSSAMQMSGMEAGALFVLEEKTGDYLSVLQRGYSPEWEQRYRRVKADTENAKMIQEGKPAYLSVEDMPSPFNEQFKAENLTYSATIPVVHNGKSVACLVVSSNTLKELSREIRRSLEYVASDIGMVIQRIRSREALEASEERYRLIADNTSDLIWAMDKNLKYTYFSPSVKRQRGFDVEEIVARDIDEVVAPSSIMPVFNAVLEALAKLKKDPGKPVTFTIDMEVYRSDGSTIWTETSLAVLGDSNGELESIIGVSRDITERRKFEAELRKSEEEYRNVVEVTYDTIAVAQEDKIKFFNHRAIELTGYSSSELYDMPIADLVFIEDRAAIADRYRRRMAGEPVDRTYSFRYVTKDGTVGWAEINIALIEWEGRPATLSSLRDITDRKRAEDALHDSEEKYRALVENAGEVILVAQDGLVKFANQRATEIVGYSIDEMKDMPFANLIDPDDLDMVAKRHLARMRGEAIEPVYDFRVVTKEGNTRWVEIHAAVINWDNKPATLNFLADITERKQAEDTIKRSEENYRLVVENAREGIVIVQDRIVKFVNRDLSRLLDYPKDEILSRPFMDFVHPDDREMVMNTHVRRLSGEPVPEMYSFRLVRRSGEELWIELRAVNVEWEGKPATLNFLPDITERKKAEDALKASEEKFRTMLEGMYEGYYEIDTTGNYTFVNDAVIQQTGYTKEELLGMNYKVYTPPEDVKRTVEIFTDVFRTGRPRHWVPLVNIRKDGSKIYLEDSIYPLRNEKGKIVGLRGLARDVTERIRWEATIRESEEKFRRLFDQSPVGAAVVSVDDYKFLSVNEAFCNLLGYPAQECTQLTFADISHPDHLANDREQVRRLASGEIEQYATDKRYIRKDGSTVWGHLSLRLIKDTEGRPLYFLPIIENISDRKKAEEDLKQALEQITSTLEGSMEAIAMMSELRDPYTAGHQRMVTKLAIAIATEIGLSEEQLRGLRVAGLLHDVGKVYVPSEILSKPGRLSELEKGLARAHAEAGYDIVKTIKFPWPVHSIILQHHERMDGSGYPKGLKGGEIMLESRILAVSDVVEAMMSHRPYRPALGLDKALEEVINNKGTLYDGHIVDVCVSLFREKGFQLTQ